MTAQIKYTREQRKAVHDLYWMGREAPQPGIRAKGRYTLKEIEQMTGVTSRTAWAIARGLR